MLFLTRGRRVFLALPLGDDHRHDLAPSGDEIGEKPRFLVAQGPDFRGRGLDEMGDHRGVDRIGLGPFAERVSEGAHLRRIDHDDRQSGARKDRRRRRSRSLRSPPGRSRAAPSAAVVRSSAARPSRVARNDETFVLSREHAHPTDFSKRLCRRRAVASILSRPCASGLRWRPKRLFGFEGRRLLRRAPSEALFQVF